MDIEPKNIALQRIREIVSSNGLSREEVLSVLGGISGQTISVSGGDKTEGFHFNIVKILYFLGGFIALSGVVVFVSQFWDTLPFFGKVAVTLGSGIIAYIISLLLRDYPSATLVSNLSLVFSALLLPTGVTVILNEMQISDWMLASLWMAIGFFMVYFSTTRILKNDVSRFLTIVCGTAIFYTSVLLFARENPAIVQTLRDFYSYMFMVYGATILALSSILSPVAPVKRPLNAILVFVGTVSVLGATFALEDFWRFACLPVIAFFFYLSIVMHKRIILVLSSIALMGYLGRLTAEYFSNSLGWPITLMLLGLLLIGVGYATFSFGKKYVSINN